MKNKKTTEYKVIRALVLCCTVVLLAAIFSMPALAVCCSDVTKCNENSVNTKSPVVADEEECVHSFTEYVSNNDATCTEDGTKTAKCDNCDETHTVVDEGSAGHKFTDYTSNGDATCTEDGTKTAKCDNCDETHTVVDEGSAGHSFSVYISDQNSTCQSKGTKTAKCDRCDATDTQEGDKYGRHQFKGVKCQNCSRGQITKLIIIAMAIGVGGFAVWFMGFDRMFRPF